MQAFYLSLSEKVKDLHWEQYIAGGNQVMVATNAASMGCNKCNVQWVVNIGVTKSLLGLGQHFGRAGRNPLIKGKCAVLVPPWSIRPLPDVLNPMLARVRGKGRVKQTEAKRDTLRREKLNPDLEEFINIATPGMNGKVSIMAHYLTYIGS